MKKRILITAAFALSLMNVEGWASESDTTIVYNNRKYILSDTDGSVSISAYNEENGALDKIYEARFEDGKKNATWQLTETVSFPFSNFLEGSSLKAKKRRRFKPHWAGVGFGFCNALTGSFKEVNEPEGFSVNFARSYEIFWNIFNYHIPFRNNHWGVVTGLGLDWRNYVMNDNHYFVKRANHLYVDALNPEASLDYSRIKTVDLTIPILFEWQTLTKRRFYVSLGPVIGIKTYTSVKTQYDRSGIRYKEFSKHINPNPINVDALVQVGYGFIGLYAKYSMFNTFQTKYAPAMHSFSTGVMLVF